MVRRSQKKRVPRHRAGHYRRVAASLERSAKDLFDLADETDRYGNAIGMLAVHAAIAWTDALTIAYGGVKATGSEHEKAADLLLEVLGSRCSAEARTTLQSILAAKDTISYAGEYYRVEDAMRVLKEMEQYCEWASKMFERRPPAAV